MPYACDFETTTREDDCRVWAVGCCDIKNPDYVSFSNSIDVFMENILKMDNAVFYFHNLKFDGNFILYWLFKHGYQHTTQKKVQPNSFSTLIGEMGEWYTIKITSPDGGKIEIRDSLKIIPLPISAIPKAFGLEEEKLELDYKEDRNPGHVWTEDEKNYLRADVVILAKALKIMFDAGMTKLTCAANALNDFKNRYDKREYKRLFPDINRIADRDIRMSYKGGWTYLNPKYKDVEVNAGVVYDVNSMYPWAMKNCLLPYGEPYFFSGEPKESKNYPLFIINFCCTFKLKPGHQPSLQIKNNWHYLENEYVVESFDETVITMTCVDYKLFLENYDVNIIEFYGGYRFKAKTGLFNDYIDYWYGMKSKSKKEKNKGMETIAKRMLNSLYGKFGAKQRGRSKIPVYNAEKDIVEYKKGEEEERKGGYLPIATFITSYCRDKIIRGAQACGGRFIYADTDSLHIAGTEPVEGLDVDEYRLGAFKKEEEFIRAKFIRQKTYLEIYEKDGEEVMNLKCAGMPARLKETVGESDFYAGAIFDSAADNRFAPKLVPKVVPGGVILKETTFTIKG